MTRAFRFAIAAGPLLLASVAAASTCPTTNVIEDPQDFLWTYHPVSAGNLEEYYSGTMEIGAVTLTIGGETVITRAYRQAGSDYTIPGPTLRMAPGNKYVLRFHNTLPYEAADPRHNIFKDPNVSNLHTHGLHISGESPGDDVTRSYEGGFGGDFVYDIPSDHMGGTHWYHAHHHGSTFLQVSAGAFGLIVIDDSGDLLPAPVSAMVERQLVVAFLDPGVAGSGGDTLISGSLSPTWTVNGKVDGALCSPPDTWQHWRVLLADRDARTKALSVGNECEVALLARDGVWRTEVPKILPNTIDLTGASRADLAVRCSADSQIAVENDVVAHIYVDGVADSAPHPWDENALTWMSDRPGYLRDLRLEAVSNTETVHMGARTINGNKFDPEVPTFTLSAARIEEWALNGARNHPFHLHVYPMQAQNDCGEYEGGEYYDTVAQNCDLRFDLDPKTSKVYDGRTIMHCHILEHEDQGAMGWADVDVEGGDGPPTFPADSGATPPYAEYYALGGGGDPTDPTTVEVGSVSVGTIGVGQGVKSGTATVVVIDDQGNLLANAVVVGEFSGTFVESPPPSSPTAADGVATFTTSGSAKGRVSVTFCVTSITHPTLTDFTAGSGEACASN